MVQNLFGDDDREGTSEAKDVPASGSLGLSEPDSGNESLDKAPFAASDPASLGETARRDGLAWSAGIAFFASVVFMLILGGGADLLLGS